MYLNFDIEEQIRLIEVEYKLLNESILRDYIN